MITYDNHQCTNNFLSIAEIKNARNYLPHTHTHTRIHSFLITSTSYACYQATLLYDQAKNEN